MRLTKLEIKGFKSFANDTVIHFNEAVTGIVGPNGSGKSNIVDAIRWVLGEQKGRELRLEQMSDVIFNGTKKRKEAPMAMVSLSFENTRNLLPVDYQQVTVSRLLYRSGESEYRINQVPCRLKDITSMFLDTGIGADSYAIIALGMVEDLLANKESARRKMFEQAAGISKYKARKKESINKLKSTTEDLARIEDLLFEINNNLVELEKQAKRAKKFYELRDKYRNAGLKLAAITVVTLREKIAKASEFIDQEMLKLSGKEAELNLSEAAAEKYKKDHLDKEKSLGEYQKKVNDLLDQIRNLEGEIQVNEQKKWFASSQIDQIQKSDAESRTRHEVLIQDLALLETEVEKTRVEFEINETDSKRKLEDLNQKQVKFEELKSGVDQEQLKKNGLEKQIFELEKKMAIDSNRQESIEQDVKRSEDEISSRLTEFHKIESEIEKVDQSRLEFTRKMEEVQEEEARRKEKLAQLKQDVDAHIVRTAAVTRKRDSKRNEFDLLKSMIDKMEGFPESTIFLSQSWKKDVPVLLDLIYTDEKYRPAIEFYLEPYLNFHVVKTEEEALHAIKLLYGNAKGKANFFILGKIDDRQFETVSMPGCRPAIELVEIDPVYQPLFRHLLQNVYIIDHEGVVDDIVKYPDQHTVISLSGSVLKRDNIITGGSVGLFEGKKLGRKKNLEKLTSEISQLDADVIQMEKQLADLKNELKKLEMGTREQELNRLVREESILLQSLTQLKTRAENLVSVRSQLEDRIKNNKEQCDLLRQSRERHLDEMSLLKSELETVNQHISASDQVFGQASTDLSTATALYNQSKLEALKWENRLQNILKDQEYKQRQFEDVQKQMEQHAERIASYRLELDELEKAITSSKASLEERYEYRKNLELDLGQMERDYLEIRNSISVRETQIRDIQKQILELQSSINHAKDQRTDLNYKIQSTLERAELEFNLKLEDYVAEEEIEQMDEDQLRDRVQYYKVRLDNYGDINPLALEAYEEMKTRYDSITEQRADILKAQESLLLTIKEIEQTATDSFLSAFHQVRLHFQNVFRSLFTQDDDCDLVLLDEMDPLECDIDIVAKPKGKRPKSIHQLSGGEKILTAIALLFALYLLKPAPFCIFDEVDAPLDDINIDKFNRIVRKFSKDSQFVIITHNKLTMAEVDVLYGVYMEEQGVSNVTAVDFRTYSHDVVLSEMEG